MTDPRKDPIKQHETIIINVCEVCNTRYSLEEAAKNSMTCCGKPLKEVEERVNVPLGP